MKKLFSRISFVLLTGYIVTYYSEWTFWQGRPLSENFLLEAVPTWLAYSVLAYFLLLTLSYFRVKSIWAFFLAGAIYGWLGEGVLVHAPGWMPFVARVVVSNVIMGAMLWYLAGDTAHWAAMPFLERVLRGGGGIALGAVVYFAVLYACGMRYRHLRLAVS